MINVVCISSLNKRYYDIAGKYAIESFLKYWPKDIKLHLYTEDVLNLKSDQIIEHNFKEVERDIDYNTFIENNVKVKKEIPMAKKAFSIMTAIDNLDADYIIWLDMDMLTIKPIDKNFVTNLCNDNLLTYMGVLYPKNERNKMNYYSSETGFFIINCNHKKLQDWCKEYRKIYRERIDYNLKRLYDNDVFGFVTHKFKKQGVNLNDLNVNHPTRKTPLTAKDNPLKKYFLHFKGGRKEFTEIKKIFNKVV